MSFCCDKALMNMQDCFSCIHNYGKLGINLCMIYVFFNFFLFKHYFMSSKCVCKKMLFDQFFCFHNFCYQKLLHKHFFRPKIIDRLAKLLQYIWLHWILVFFCIFFSIPEATDIPHTSFMCFIFTLQLNFLFQV